MSIEYNVPSQGRLAIVTTTHDYTIYETINPTTLNVEWVVWVTDTRTGHNVPTGHPTLEGAERLAQAVLTHPDLSKHYVLGRWPGHNND